ncbi:HAMP domain-containing sensor histidine kinase [uncultured Anaerococcus sp.]|jgi:periplasmic sensor signal transduction histidine kinase|uniref:sensor histidine kinase n=2 Tax=Anaerococcus TaxID=165779 RepID=UPI00280BB661|nr:HAMP domain-containing sensor histidine kinase [uncultured Anaerococcus sp.]MDU0894377.1 HAMP domain-containing sensor histidine kinase [Anaerococcus sp.]
MKYSFLKNIIPSIVIIILTNFLFVFLIYVVNGKIIKNILAIIIIFSIISIGIILLKEINRQRNIKKSLSKFYKKMDYESMDKLIDVLGIDYKSTVYNIFNLNKSLNEKIEKQRIDLLSYKDIIEKWVHEVKVPISSLDLVLENNQNDIKSSTYEKLLYTSQLIKVDLDLILYFARSNSIKTDYDLKELNIKEVVYKAISDYYPILSEKEIKIIDEIKDMYVLSDFYTLKFIISQIISNAIKYTIDTINFKTIIGDNKILIITNNGKHIDNQDLPFIFEKGYTGKSSKNSLSTGLGLYLVKKYTDDLGIDVNVLSNKDGEFSMGLCFYGKM